MAVLKNIGQLLDQALTDLVMNNNKDPDKWEYCLNESTRLGRKPGLLQLMNNSFNTVFFNLFMDSLLKMATRRKVATNKQREITRTSMNTVYNNRVVK